VTLIGATLTARLAPVLWVPFILAQPELKVVRKGRVRLIPVSELDRWLDENATSALRCDVRLLRTLGISWATFFQRFPAVPSGF
jgi:hypothetical protein